MRRMSGRTVRPRSAMPFLRYFLSVGGGLLALLFAANAVLPPPTDGNARSEPRLPKIRIQSEHQDPQAVVIDTTQPAIAPIVTMPIDATTPSQAIIPAAPQLRESLAQMASPVPEQAEMSKPKNTEKQPRSKRKIARAHVKHPSIPSVQPRSFGLFDREW